MNNKNSVHKITNAAIFAAIIACASLVNRYITGHGTVVAKFLGATKETQFYIIPALTIYMVKKFGLKHGFITSISGALIGLTSAFFLGTTGGKANIISFMVNYILPWILCTLIAFVAGKSNIKIIITSMLIWLGVLISWSIAGVMFWKLTFQASMLWGFVTYQGWAMFILMPIVNMITNNKIFNSKI